MNKETEPGKLITIIIPVYNAEKYIAGCLESIFKLQSLPIEVLVLDGGSTDQTIDILSQFNNSILKWKSEPDKGIYDAMNKGIKIASGRWLYFMGADDRVLPGFADLASKLMNEDTVYYGNSIPFYEEGVTVDPYGLLKGAFSPYRLAKYCMNHQSILYPARAFRDYSYELKYKIAADYAFNLRLWGDEKFKKEFFPIDIVSYNMGGFSAGNSDQIFISEKSSLIRKRMGWRVYIRYLIRGFKDKSRHRKGV
ncbi:MAG: glycosyltransferase family 2 protein [Pedobacter sp.]|uniref:glycosyltransferase family 2 protein n=1 Tax=Pedobacter sp. TaxID=1411316 RepID=UPI0033937358